MKKTFFISIILTILTFGFANSIYGQGFRAIATAFEIKDRKDLNFGGHNVGKLYITVNGTSRKIAGEAGLAWIINKGKEVVYSSADGSGGFENIGQSLRIYNVKTKKTRKIFSEYFPLLGLTEVKLSTGERALLVRGYGAETECIPFAVVNPKRGEVFTHCSAQLLKLNGDFITLAIDPEYPEDWFADEKNQTAFEFPRPEKFRKTRTYDLKRIIKRKVIYNRKTE